MWPTLIICWIIQRFYAFSLHATVTHDANVLALSRYSNQVALESKLYWSARFVVKVITGSTYFVSLMNWLMAREGLNSGRVKWDLLINHPVSTVSNCHSSRIPFAGIIFVFVFLHSSIHSICVWTSAIQKYTQSFQFDKWNWQSGLLKYRMDYLLVVYWCKLK